MSSITPSGIPIHTQPLRGWIPSDSRNLRMVSANRTLTYLVTFVAEEMDQMAGELDGRLKLTAQVN